MVGLFYPVRCWSCRMPKVYMESLHTSLKLGFVTYFWMEFMMLNLLLEGFDDCHCM